MTMTQTDLNWDYVKQTVEALAKEVDACKEFQVESFAEFTNDARMSLMDILELNQDGYPYTEIGITGHNKNVGIPISLAEIFIGCVAFAKFTGIDLTDAIKMKLNQ